MYVAPGFALGLPPFQEGEADLALVAGAGAGTVTGRVTPSASGGLGATVDLLQEVSLEGAASTFVVRTVAVAGDGTFRFARVPAGTYSAALSQVTRDPELGLVNQRTVTAAFQVAAGFPTDLLF